MLLLVSLKMSLEILGQPSAYSIYTQKMASVTMVIFMCVISLILLTVCYHLLHTLVVFFVQPGLTRAYI